MELQLRRYRDRGERIEHPTLHDILDAKAPFHIIDASVPYNDRRLDLVFGEWQKWHAYERILQGIKLFDYEHNRAYFAKKGSNTFYEAPKELWHRDKFGAWANVYAMTGSAQELFDEFKNLGFVFGKIDQNTTPRA